jgi:hypothetical protein
MYLNGGRMALQLEGISVVIPLSKIYEVYEGGKEAFWLDNHPSESECDGELIRMSFSNSIDVKVMIEDWKRRGLKPTRKLKGKIFWQDLCVVNFFSGPTLPCDWLDYDSESGVARLSPSLKKNCNCCRLTQEEINTTVGDDMKEGYTQDVLHLSNLECYPEFIRNPENLGGKRGVYIWGFRFFDPKKESTSDFIPYYVGKHRSNIHRRLQEHVMGIREGTHKILYKEHLCNPQKFRLQEPKDHAFLNMGNKDDKKRRKDTLSPEERTALAPHINAYIDNLFVTYIDISHLKLPENDEKEYVDRLERYIQKIIGDERTSSRSGVVLPEGFRPKIIPSKGTEHILNNYPMP